VFYQEGPGVALALQGLRDVSRTDPPPAQALSTTEEGASQTLVGHSQGCRDALVHTMILMGFPSWSNSGSSSSSSSSPSHLQRHDVTLQCPNLPHHLAHRPPHCKQWLGTEAYSSCLNWKARLSARRL